MRAHLAYLCYVVIHKWFVFLACLKYKVPFWRAVVHDWSKFTPAEWGPYVRAFYNPDGSKKIQSKENKTLEVSRLADEFKYAWNHHQKSNPHHWQYFVLMNDEDGVQALPMPETYVREMLADWEGAGLAITGQADPLGWYARNKDKFIMHPRTKYLVITILAEAGVLQ